MHFPKNYGGRPTLYKGPSGRERDRNRKYKPVTAELLRAEQIARWGRTNMIAAQNAEANRVYAEDRSAKKRAEQIAALKEIADRAKAGEL